MKIQRCLGVVLLLGSSVWAQPAGEGRAVTEPQTQRRAELRQALQAPPPLAGAAAPFAPRQLSPQERQALREQLRQQRVRPGAARPQP